MKSILINRKESRLRTGWRILIFLLIFWTLSISILAIRPLLGDISKSTFIKDYSLIIIAMLSLIASTAVSLGRKFLDKKSLASLGLTWNKLAVKDLIFGFLLSGFMALLFFTILLGTGLITFEGINFTLTPLKGEAFDYLTYMSVISIGSLFLLLLQNTLTGYWEELVFRGYLLQNMAEGLGWLTAIVTSCILYGVIHAANPNAGVLSTVIIMAFGYLRIYGYLSTKMLWLSMGMHIGWNFFQGNIFGFAASGHENAHLTDISLTSDKTWLTGGAFGPEGSILILPILILAGIIMHWYSKNYRHTLS